MSTEENVFTEHLRPTCLLTEEYAEQANYEDANYFVDEDEGEEGLVLNCGVRGCLMPGYHFLSECHTSVDLEAEM
ncbi:hypothetical protein [Vacuolonema iberomarrocanum]|uniref:hypothetical protein n=1 Tax=Vacuolonema iberomarrocanum TaxID=3454632 RepID=UPI0019F910C6|nr:hypothetical protein [filamentous cyanobacterium LEGE 07170]